MESAQTLKRPRRPLRDFPRGCGRESKERWVAVPRRLLFFGMDFKGTNDSDSDPGRESFLRQAKECVLPAAALRQLVKALPGNLGSKFFNFGPSVLVFLRFRPGSPLLLSFERNIDLILAIGFVVSQQAG